MESEASLPSVGKVKKIKTAPQQQTATPGVKGVPAQQSQEKRRVKLKRDGLPGQPVAGPSSKPDQSSDVKVPKAQSKRTVKALKRKSTETDPLADIDNSAPSEISLSKNQMEILELEMRARAIKAMLKMHSN